LDAPKTVVGGIDLAGTDKNPTGWALLKNTVISTCHLYSNQEILKKIRDSNATFVAIDAPLSLPKKGEFTRKTDREMHKRGYPVFPPRFRTMEKLTLRAIQLKQQISSQGVNVIEVHPASTRKALKMPTKDWSNIQAIFARMGLESDLKTRALTPHEIDAVTAALTGQLLLKGQTELVGDRREGFIVVPIRSDWENLKL